MLTFFLISGLIFLVLLALIGLFSLAPANTICPFCRKKKKPSEYGWKTLCSKCEGGKDE